MSDPAAPWWADVQHLRPREDRASDATPPARFAREAGARTGDVAPSASSTSAAVATLEHEVPAEPQVEWHEPRTPRWLETLSMPQDPSPSRVWDPSLEAAFASTPSWADEDDERLLPKGANRIENGRRTIEIRGQVDRVVGVTAPAETGVATRSGRRRPARRPAERLAGRPDRVAMWAFLLGILLILIAALSEPGRRARAAALAARRLRPAVAAASATPGQGATVRAPGTVPAQCRPTARAPPTTSRRSSRSGTSASSASGSPTSSAS